MIQEQESGNVLVIDTEPGVRRTLRSTLGALGFRADEASSGEHGMALARRNRYDSILFNFHTPGYNGVEICRALRRECPNAGIVALSARAAEDDKVEALDAGADDYVTKPFVVRELTARMGAVRRGRLPGNEASVVAVTVGAIELDPVHRSVAKGGAPLHLTPKEFEVLEFLMRHAGAPVRHQALLQAVWGPEYGGEVEYLRTFVRQLRKKLEDDPAQPRYLKTDAFVGYRFCAPGE